MTLLQRIAQDLRAGWAALRQGTAEVATRALEESEVVRLRLQLRKLDERIDHLYEDIGERAVTQCDKGEPLGRVMQEPDMTALLVQLQEARRERETLAAEIENVRSGL